MNSEQQEELEVLQSIFPDTFSVISFSPPEWQLKIDGDMITIHLNVTLPEAYPNEVPEISIDCPRGKYPEVAKLKSDLLEEAQRGLGMAMVFSLVTLIEERLADFAKTVRAAEKKAAAVDKKDSYNDIRKFDGTPVTAERFHEWNKKFLAEMSAKKAIIDQQRKAELGNKLTGRQLFEQNKVTASSDTAFYDETGLNIDEAVFEGLEDLAIDEVEEDISEDDE